MWSLVEVIPKNKYEILDNLEWESFKGKTRGQLNKALNGSTQSQTGAYLVVHAKLNEKMNCDFRKAWIPTAVGICVLIAASFAASVWLSYGGDSLFLTIGGSLACGAGALALVPIAIGGYKAKQYYTFSRHKLTREDVDAEKKAIKAQIQHEINSSKQLESTFQARADRLQGVLDKLTETELTEIQGDPEPKEKFD